MIGDGGRQHAPKFHGSPAPMNPVGKGKKQVKYANAGKAQVKIRNQAIAAVRNALSEGGMASSAAQHYAQVLLTRPGVEIGAGGKILYNGKAFAPAAFAQSNLAKYVTGAQAAANNQKAITTDPGYLQALASLGLARDDAISPLQDSRRQALIQFGDPSFVQNDPLTAGAAAANPFSTEALLQNQFGRNINAVNENSNRYGTYQGGGRVSGLNEGQRVFAANEQDATIKLQNLLSQINQQIGSAQQAYNVGQSGAQLDAYNNLLASGAIHATAPPNLGVGSYNYHGQFGTPVVNNGGGGVHIPAPNPGQQYAPPPPPSYPAPPKPPGVI